MQNQWLKVDTFLGYFKHGVKTKEDDSDRYKNKCKVYLLIENSNFIALFLHLDKVNKNTKLFLLYGRVYLVYHHFPYFKISFASLFFFISYPNAIRNPIICHPQNRHYYYPWIVPHWSTWNRLMMSALFCVLQSSSCFDYMLYAWEKKNIQKALKLADTSKSFMAIFLWQIICPKARFNIPLNSVEPASGLNLLSGADLNLCM